MNNIAPSLLETLDLVSLAIVVACFVAAVGGLIRYTTRLPGNTVKVYWLMKLGIFVGVPFGIVGMVSGYMTGSSRVGAISNLVPAALTLIGAVAALPFHEGREVRNHVGLRRSELFYPDADRRADRRV